MSEQASQIREFYRANVKPHMQGELNVEERRVRQNAMLSSQTPAPADVQIESIHPGDISTERLSTPTALPNAAILYFHGGGYSVGTAQSVRPMAWRLAKLTDVPVYVINYRLAPEHPYPAGLDDCEQAYDALLEQGIPASSIVVAGDSSGGTFTFALVHRLKAANKPQPAALVGLSSITDLTCSGTSFNANVDADVLITPKFMRWVVSMYIAQSKDLTNPFLSPLYGDVAGFPPTYLLASADEILLDDSTRMAEKMQKAGVAVTLDVWPELWHDWPVNADMVPEGVQALEKIAVFIVNHIQK
jgi:acetyl esterase/lipase